MRAAYRRFSAFLQCIAALLPALACAAERYVVLVAEIDDLLIDSRADIDGDAALRMIGHPVHRALHGVEIARPVRTHGNARRARFRSCLGGETPAFARDAREGLAGDDEDRRIDLNVVGPAALEQVVVRVDRRGPLWNARHKW